MNLDAKKFPFQEVNHPNLVKLKYYCHSMKVGIENLDLFMDYVQDNLHRVIVVFRKRCKLIPAVLIKVVTR